jgi:hypothetical protein
MWVSKDAGKNDGFTGGQSTSQGRPVGLLHGAGAGYKW